MINRSNYEIYFVDYADGNLSPQQVADLFLFLEKNPDLKAAFESFENIQLIPEHISFAEKDLLKKNKITAENFNEYAVAYVENALSTEDKKAYLNFIQTNAAFKKEHNLFAKTKLIADAAIVYKNKQALKRNAGKIISLSFIRYAAAACVLIVAGFYFLNREEISRQQAANKPATNANGFDTLNMATQPSPEKVVPAPEKSIEQNKMELASEITSNKKEKTNNNVNIQVAIISSKTKNEKQKPVIEINRKIEMVDATSLTASTIPIPVVELKAKPSVYIDDSYALVMSKATPTINEAFYQKQEVLKEMAVKRLNAIAMKDDVETAEDAPTKKVRILALFGKVVNKVTFKQVNIETTYSVEGNLMAYSVTAGKLNYERQVSK